MDTPVWDFLQAYQSKGTTRFHMPGHKGMPFLGCEQFDLTEISGADNLYEPDGIIARSEANAAALFGAKQTLYATEGSTQCIKGMLTLAITNRKPGTEAVIVAARNVHKAFGHAAACLDFKTVWLMPEKDNTSLCSCPISAEAVACALDSLPQTPAAVYLTSPDYLGGQADIKAIAQVCHERDVLLLVDNAHGAYLKFLTPSQHPLDLGADMCCDSAHKTLPVLTGGAYLHLRDLPQCYTQQARSAMAIFGSTSPSYLTLASLDLCNRYLSDSYSNKLKIICEQILQAKKALTNSGWRILESDPLRLTIAAPAGQTGMKLAELLRQHNMECEYADPDYLVLMLTPENTPDQLKQLVDLLGINTRPYEKRRNLVFPAPQQTLSIRKALFSPHETVDIEQSLGRICGAPTVACPPAVPIVLSGERITEDAITLFRYYGFKKIDVIL